MTRSQSVAGGLARRARILLLAADGMPLSRIADRGGVDRNTVKARLDRYRQQGLAGRAPAVRPAMHTGPRLLDAPG